MAPCLFADWANAVERLGHVPLYAARVENRSSLRLAEKTGFLPNGETLSLSPIQ